jgi:hypothetical protein
MVSGNGLLLMFNTFPWLERNYLLATRGESFLSPKKNVAAADDFDHAAQFREDDFIRLSTGCGSRG